MGISNIYDIPFLLYNLEMDVSVLLAVLIYFQRFIYFQYILQKYKDEPISDLFVQYKYVEVHSIFISSNRVISLRLTSDQPCCLTVFLDQNLEFKPLLGHRR